MTKKTITTVMSIYLLEVYATAWAMGQGFEKELWLTIKLYKCTTTILGFSNSI